MCILDLFKITYHIVFLMFLLFLIQNIGISLVLFILYFGDTDRNIPPERIIHSDSLHLYDDTTSPLYKPVFCGCLVEDGMSTI